MIKKASEDILKKYLAYKNSLKLGPRYLEAFEFRQGLIDGKPHSLRETGERLGVTGHRIRQLEGRLLYELEQVNESLSSSSY